MPEKRTIEKGPQGQARRKSANDAGGRIRARSAAANMGRGRRNRPLPLASPKPGARALACVRQGEERLRSAPAGVLPTRMRRA